MDRHEEFFRSLPSEEVQLLALREILYDGSWVEMVKDLEARRSGKPYVIKLQSRIEEDLGRIRKLDDYEREHGVDLGRYISQEALSEGETKG
jgi:hypothetical protein